MFTKLIAPSNMKWILLWSPKTSPVASVSNASVLSPKQPRCSSVAFQSFSRYLATESIRPRQFPVVRFAKATISRNFKACWIGSDEASVASISSTKSAACEVSGTGKSGTIPRALEWSCTVHSSALEKSNSIISKAKFRLANSSHFSSTWHSHSQSQNSRKFKQPSSSLSADFSNIATLPSLTLTGTGSSCKVINKSSAVTMPVPFLSNFLKRVDTFSKPTPETTWSSELAAMSRTGKIGMSSTKSSGTGTSTDPFPAQHAPQNAMNFWGGKA